MRDDPVQVPEPQSIPTAPAPPERAKYVSGTNGNKRQDATFLRHSRLCVICNHPDRAAIEFDFLNWRNPGDIVQSYRFRGLSTIYRHAHATGLFAKRRLNLRFAMERIVERVNEVPVTANAVIRAARAVSRINDSGEWVDPPSRLIVEHVNSAEAGNPAAASSATVGSGFSPDPSPEESLVGRGFNRDKKRRRSKPSIQTRQGGEGKATSTPAHDAASGHGFSRADKKSQETEFLSRAPRGLRYHRDTSARDESQTVARPSLIFDNALLDEPSDSATCELPRINGKPPEPEIVLEISPSLYGAVQARREAAKVRLAPWSNPEWERLATAAQQGPSAPQGQSASPPSSSLPTSQKEQSVGTSPSLLPQAASDQQARSAERSASGVTDHYSRNTSFSTLPEAASPSSAPSALPHPAAAESKVADVKSNVATPSSLLPQAAVPSGAPPAPSVHESRVTGHAQPAIQRHIGSAGSADPPFPFDPPPLRRWKPRRRF